MTTRNFRILNHSGKDRIYHIVDNINSTFKFVLYAPKGQYSNSIQIPTRKQLIITITGYNYVVPFGCNPGTEDCNIVGQELLPNNELTFTFMFYKDNWI